MPDRNIAYFVVTLGVTQILSGIFSVTYGRWSDQFNLPPIVSGVTFIGPFPMTNNRIFVLARRALLLALLFVMLRFHPYGRALRAVFQNREAAALRGVNVRAIYRLSFVLGMLSIFAGGMLYGMAYRFDLTVAWTMAVTAFAIMIVGGPGSVLGARRGRHGVRLHPGRRQHLRQSDGGDILLSRRHAGDSADQTVRAVRAMRRLLDTAFKPQLVLLACSRPALDHRAAREPLLRLRQRHHHDQHHVGRRHESAHGLYRPGVARLCRNRRRQRLYDGRR